jgi:hypothetical protein
VSGLGPQLLQQEQPFLRPAVPPAITLTDRPLEQSVALAIPSLSHTVGLMLTVHRLTALTSCWYVCCTPWLSRSCRGFCAVESADGWYAAVRHIGGLFDLPPNRDPYDSLGLPFPCLATTLSTVQLEPAANVWEHFSPPGSAADLAARARDKQAR